MDWLLPEKDDYNIAKRIFVLAVTAIAIVPRMPFDTPLSIGGNLSSSFRKLVLFICSLNMTRFLLFVNQSNELKLFLTTLEGISISFLSLLTPYLFRVWLSDRINVPGGRRPGRALMPWVYTFAILSLLGFFLQSFYGSKHLWIFKKIADALSFIPVQRTLHLYNSFTTADARYPGRGSVLAQIVLVGEYYALFAHLRDIVIKGLEFSGALDESTAEKNLFIKALYTDNLYASYTRILCHSILLNALDEMQHFHATSPTSNESNNNDGAREETDGLMVVKNVLDYN
jgi:hypothetical protein